MRQLILTAGLLLIAGCGNYKELKNAKPFAAGKTGVTPTSLDFKTVKQKILLKHCTQCHTHPGRHNLFTNYSFVKQNATEMLARMRLPSAPKRMPSGGAPPLDARLIAMFAEWVDAGTPEFSSAEEEVKNQDPVPQEELIGFQDFKDRILKPYNCTACHSQYNSYGPVRRDLGAIASSIHEDKMPFPTRKNRPVDPVTDRDKAFVLQWVAEGAPEVPGISTLPPKTPPLEPTWISLRNQVFGPKCILCHNSYGNRGGAKRQSFETFGMLRNWFREAPELFNLAISTDKPSYGLFVESLERDEDDFLASLMPYNTDQDDVNKNIERLSAKEIQVIKKWIELKLPYDEDEL